MTLVDWRDVPSEVVQPLLLAERRRALDTLHWDLSPSLKAVELARQRGDLAGLLLYDAKGRPVGWAFYLLANRLLQIGGLSAPTAGGLRVLLDRVLESPEAQLAQGVSCFLEAKTRSLTSALTRLRFDIQRHVYLEATLTTPWPAPRQLPDAAARWSSAMRRRWCACWREATPASASRRPSRRTRGWTSGRTTPASFSTGPPSARGGPTSRLPWRCRTASWRRRS